MSDFDSFIPGMEVEAPVQETTAPDPTQQKIDALATTVHNMASSQQSEAALLREFLKVKSEPQDKPEQAKLIPVGWDESSDPNDPKAFIDPKHIDAIAQQRAEQLFNERIKPYEGVLEQSKTQREIDDAIKILEKAMPDVMSGAEDKTWMAQRAMEFYNSRYNPGTTDAEKAAWTEQNLRRVAGTVRAQQDLPMSTGASVVPAYNAVGNTLGHNTGGNARVSEFASLLGVDPSSIPAPGSTIKLPAKSIDELGGLQQYKEYNRRRYAMMDYNGKHKLWTITE